MENHGRKKFNPITWAFALVIVILFSSVSYRVITSCEQSSFELLNKLKVSMGGCQASKDHQVTISRENIVKQSDVKTLDISLGTGALRDYCASNPGMAPPVFLLNPSEQVVCNNGTTDTKRPICLCP